MLKLSTLPRGVQDPTDFVMYIFCRSKFFEKLFCCEIYSTVNANYDEYQISRVVAAELLRATHSRTIVVSRCIVAGI